MSDAYDRAVVRRAAFLTVLLLAIPVPAWGHGIGGRSDLPLPLEVFLVGGGVILIVTFVALSVLWPEARWQQASDGRVLLQRIPRWLPNMLLVIGILGLVAIVVTGSFGQPLALSDVVMWVGVWLFVPFTAALVVDIHPWLDPFQVAARSKGRSWNGVWPAAGAFLGVTWLELVSPTSGAPVLGWVVLVYAVYLVIVGRRRGRLGLASADAFRVYASTLGAMAPIGRDDQGRLVWRGFLRGLPALADRPGLVVFVVLMLGTVTYDGLSNSLWWRETFGSAVGTVWFGSLALVGVSAIIGGAYWLAASAAARSVGGTHTASSVARRFAHTLVPIAFAYAFSHYFTLLLFEGQQIVATLSDPFGRGWDLFGGADAGIDYFLAPVAVWWIQAATTVLGHIGGVVLAHDRALADFGPVEAVRSQYAMLVLMVLLTGLGLTVLAVG